MGRSSSESSSSSDESDAKPPPSSDSDASSAEEDFVVQEKKHGRIRREEEGLIRTKKSLNVGRKYRKQDEDSKGSSSSSGSDSDSEDEVNSKKRRMMSSIVVAKGSRKTTSSSSEDEEDRLRKHQRSNDSGAKQRLLDGRIHRERPMDVREHSNKHFSKSANREKVDGFRDTSRKLVKPDRLNDPRRSRNQEERSKHRRKQEKVESEDGSEEETKAIPNRTYKDEKRHPKRDSVKEERASGRPAKREPKEEPDIERNFREDRKRHKDNKSSGRDRVKREEDDIRTHHNNCESNHDRDSNKETRASGWGQTEASTSTSTTATTTTTTSGESKPVEKEKENFGLSGKLTEYTNTYNGVVIIYNEPPEARKPKTRWRFYPFKGDKSLTMLQLHRQSAFLLGRDRTVADIPVDHPSCSKQHAVLQFRLVPFEKANGDMGKKVKPYIIDLDSRNGTHVNNNRIEARKYVELRERDVIKFGFSSRDYVLLHEKSEDVDSADDQGEGETVEAK